MMEMIDTKASDEPISMGRLKPRECTQLHVWRTNTGGALLSFAYQGKRGKRSVVISLTAEEAELIARKLAEQREEK